MEIQKGEFTLLRPASNKCQICAVEHEPAFPHNRDSLYYQVWFAQQYGRSPTWSDAMEHCSDEVKQAMVGHLRSLNVSEEAIGIVGSDRDD